MRIILAATLALFAFAFSACAPAVALDGPLWPESKAVAIRRQLLDPNQRSQAIHALRQHGWGILKMVMADSRRPDWYYKWCTIDEVYSGVPCPSPKRVQYTKPGGTPKEDLPGINSIMSSSYYNTAMVNYLRQRLSTFPWPSTPATAKLGDDHLAMTKAGDAARHLVEMFQAQGATEMRLPIAPADAVIVKPGWYRLPCPKQDTDPVPSIGVYTGPSEQGWDPQNANGLRRSIRPSDLNYGACTVSPAKMAVDDPAMLRRDDFFYFRSLQGNNVEVDGLPDGKVVAGDYLLMVGLHVITHEQADWIWTTFWWSPTPTEIDDRPDWVAKDRKLKYFNMRISMDLSDGPVFNPYLEGKFPDGVKSHCMACHRSALVEFPTPDPEAATLKFTAPKFTFPFTHPDCVGSTCLPDCARNLCTNSVWSIARRAADYQY